MKSTQIESTGMEGLDRILLDRGILKSKEGNLNSSQRKIEEEQKKNSYSCEECEDIGLVRILTDDGRVAYKPCICRELNKINKDWKSSGIKIKDLDKSFKNFETWNAVSEKMKTTATNYYLRFDKVRELRCNSIMLCGNPGSGKSHLSMALAGNFLKQRKLKVVYMPYRDIVTSIKQNMIDNEFYKKTLLKYQTCEVLLIDDLFKGKITESDINIMFEIVNYRYNNYLPMIISTEYTVNKLLNFDEAIGSRIYEMCKNFMVEIEGIENNYRIKK